MAKYSYKNPWHKPGKPEYGPWEYETDVTPVEHRGYLIYPHAYKEQHDIVLNDVCLSQRVTLRNAKGWIDEDIDIKEKLRAAQ